MSDLPTLARLALDVGAALESRAGRLLSPEGFDDLVRTDLGIDAPQPVGPLTLDPGRLQSVTEAIDALGDALGDDAMDERDVELRALVLAGAVAAAVEDVAGAAARLIDGSGPPLDDLPRRLVDWLVLEQVQSRSFLVIDGLRALGLADVEPVPTDPAGVRPEPVVRAVHLDVLGTLLTDPGRWLRETYGWGGPDSRMDVLLDRLFDLGVALGVRVEQAGTDLHRLRSLGATDVDPEDPDLPMSLRLPIVGLQRNGGLTEAGLALVVLPAAADASVGEGLALVPFATAAAGVDIPLGLLGEWVLSLTGSVGAEGGLGLVARPGMPLTAVADLDGAGGVATAGRFEVAVRRSASADEVALVRFGGGSGLFVTGVSARVVAAFEAHAEPELVAEVGVQQAKLRIALGGDASGEGGGDGFVRSALPDQLELAFDAGVGISSRRGVYLVGGAGLEVSRRLGVQVGAVTIEQLTTRVRGGDHGLSVEAEAVVSLALGPFAASIDGLGARLALEQKVGGNLGPVDADLGFKPPTGVGLAISSPELSGGGFLRFDPDNGRYAGVFELTLLDTVSVKAVAMVTTNQTDDRSGFSLLVLITAEGFTPVPLGFGFTLTGIGGLVALNRTIDVEAVRRGLSTGLLDSVLFAKDPVANAEAVLATLDQVFPLAPDRLLIGPLAEISWGTPPVVKVRLALLLEVPQPLRAVLLAALSVLLPDPDDPVAELHIDAIGVLDLGRGQLALDAALHHSRLAGFGLTGDMALRLNWGEDPLFLLSIGGFHPRFTPPAGLRRLERITFSLTGGDNPRVRFESYLAVTSNTIQLGARVALRAEAAGFGIDGGGAFDALVQWSPFRLDVGLEAWVRVFSPAGTLFGAHLQVQVTGPQPWHVKGSISFDILWWTITTGIDFTIGDPQPPLPLDTVDIAGLLFEELARPGAWSTTLPPGVPSGVTLGGDPTMLVHPLGTISVRQKTVPLGTRVTRMGAQRPRAGTRTYDLDVDGPAGLVGEALLDQFAPAQFTDLSDDQKLAAPSFTRMPAGTSFRPTATTATPADRAVTTDLVFETLDLAGLDTPATIGAPAPPAVALLDAEQTRSTDIDRPPLQVVTS